MTKRTDVVLAVWTLALVLLIIGGIAATGSLDEFAAWAWARHHNVLSWYIRVLFLLPFCYFAYKRSLFGMTLTLVALATSMFWFPAPERPDPRAFEFLAMEREYLSGEWTTAKILLGLLVPGSLAVTVITPEEAQVSLDRFWSTIGDPPCARPGVTPIPARWLRMSGLRADGR